MRTRSITTEDFLGVLPVPPLARSADGHLDFTISQRIVDHIASGSIRTFLYGGNAFLYHLTLAEYEALLDWLSCLDHSYWVIPSAGPSYGRAMDQAALLRRLGFPCVMMLPCGDPRDARGLEAGYRRFADACGTPLIVYLKEENNMGGDKDAGLDAIARLVSDGVCIGIKYAVVRKDPNQDAYLESLLQRVERARVISGMGERPAIAHMRDWKLPGFTTGSGCIAPRLSLTIHEHCVAGEFEPAGQLRELFLPLEDLRDAWGPARVLHAATALAGIAPAGPIAPYVTDISAAQSGELAPAARALLSREVAARATSTRLARA